VIQVGPNVLFTYETNQGDLDTPIRVKTGLFGDNLSDEQWASKASDGVIPMQVEIKL
jgi:hypothetical protein